jgi:hypothetical protein
MTVWADADSLPREVKNLIARRASSPQGGGSPQDSSPGRGVTRAVFVANRPMALPPGSNLIAVTVGPAGASKGPDGQAAPPADRMRPSWIRLTTTSCPPQNRETSW